MEKFGIANSEKWKVEAVVFGLISKGILSRGIFNFL